MKFKLDHGYLTYDRIGKGVPLLLIHGFPLSRKMWAPQVTALSDIASLITVDLRGHGESFPFEPPYSMDMLAEDCKLFLDNLKIQEPIIVCGLSMGGYVTLSLYRKYPHIFKGMILTSTRAGADSPEGKTNRSLSIRNVRDHGVEFIADGMLAKTVSPQTFSTQVQLIKTIRNIMLETSVQGVIGASQAMRDRPDSTPLLSQIKVPALIIHGSDDQLIPVHEAESMNKAIPNSRMELISKAGHLLNMEQPENFNQVARDFIKSLA